MSITSDIRSYADTALEQGKHVVGQAQTQLTDVTGQANEFVSKAATTVTDTAKDLTGSAKENVSGFTAKLTGGATDAVNDLRTQAEKAINLDAIKTAVEPYLAQAKHYSSSVTDRAEGILESVRNDKRVTKVITTAEAITGVVVDTVNHRVVQPVASFTGRGSKTTVQKPATAKKSTAKPATKSTSKPATTRPAAAAKKTAPATKARKVTSAAASKTATKTAPAKAAARKAPAKATSATS